MRSVLKPPSARKIFPQGGYIAALAKRFLSGDLEACTTDALEYEKFYQPSGRFKGENYGDVFLLEKISYKKITTLERFSFSIPSDDVVERVREHIHQFSEPEFLRIRNALPDDSSQDAWHLYCTKKHSLDIFLTVDVKLIAQINSISDKALRVELQKTVRTPEGLCSDLKIAPLSDDEIIRFARNDLSADPFFLPAPIVKKTAMLKKIREFFKELVHKRA